MVCFQLSVTKSDMFNVKCQAKSNFWLFVFGRREICARFGVVFKKKIDSIKKMSMLVGLNFDKCFSFSYELAYNYMLKMDFYLSTFVNAISYVLKM